MSYAFLSLKLFHLFFLLLTIQWLNIILYRGKNVQLTQAIQDSSLDFWRNIHGQGYCVSREILKTSRSIFQETYISYGLDMVSPPKAHKLKLGPQHCNVRTAGPQRGEALCGSVGTPSWEEIKAVLVRFLSSYKKFTIGAGTMAKSRTV